MEHVAGAYAGVAETISACTVLFLAKPYSPMLETELRGSCLSACMHLLSLSLFLVLSLSVSLSLSLSASVRELVSMRTPHRRATSCMLLPLIGAG